MGLGWHECGHFDIGVCAAQQFLHVCLEEYNLKWDWMVRCHFTPECSNETEQRKEIHWWPLASPHHCRSCLSWCKDQLTPAGRQTNGRTTAPRQGGDARTATDTMAACPVLMLGRIYIHRCIGTAGFVDKLWNEWAVIMWTDVQAQIPGRHR